MIVGIGSHATVASVSVRWPSGKTTSTQAVPEGTLLTVHENPADSPSGEAFIRNSYRAKLTPPPVMRAKPVFGVRDLDTGAKPARLRVYTAFTTSSPSVSSDVAALRRLKETLGSEGVDIVAVPIDEADNTAKLAAFAKEWKPTSRLIDIAPAKRVEAIAAYVQALGQNPPVPSTVITDDSGHVLSAQAGLPSISTVRRLLTPDGR
jgi:hypothetical protein